MFTYCFNNEFISIFFIFLYSVFYIVMATNAAKLISRFGTIKFYCIVLYCIVLYCIVLYCIVLYCIVLYCIVLYCIVLYCIVLYCIVLYCIVLYCIVLYCIVLYCIVVTHLLSNICNILMHEFLKVFRNNITYVSYMLWVGNLMLRQ